MRRFHATALAAASLAFLSLGAADAQTVSGSDPYAQGYAAGAAVQHQNSFDTFQNGVQAGQSQQTTTDQAYNNGYQAALAANKADSNSNQTNNQAYTDGYNEGAVDGSRASYGSFADGFRMGRDEQLRLDQDYPPE